MLPNSSLVQIAPYQHVVVVMSIVLGLSVTQRDCESPHGSIQSPGQPTGLLTGLIKLPPFRGLDQVKIPHELKDVRELSKESN